MKVSKNEIQHEFSSVTIDSRGITDRAMQTLWREKTSQNVQAVRNNLRIRTELSTLLNAIQPVDFRDVTDSSNNEKIGLKHFVVGVIDELIRIAHSEDWGLCVNNEQVYIYNGRYWMPTGIVEFKVFLGKASEIMGVPSVDAKHYLTQDHLYKQFLLKGAANAPKRDKNSVLINLKNGTYEITDNGHRFRGFDREDFLTYQLPFDFDSNSLAPIFMNYLNQVLPNRELQMILAEYLGYVFAKKLKLDKFLVLLGSGANGKSVFFDIVTALLGPENVSNFSLKNLNEENNRALIMDKLLNYGSEINASIEHDIFKVLVSGEPIQARLKYQNSMMMKEYARLCFNCNELPTGVEHTEAYWRRFLIVPFDTYIPEADRDPELSQKIVSNELSGIFNWVIEGLNSLLANRKFTESDVVRKTLQEYQTESDSVYMFLEDSNYRPSSDLSILLSDFYCSYGQFCNASGYHKVSIKKFAKRLRHYKFTVARTGANGKVHVFATNRSLSR